MNRSVPRYLAAMLLALAFVVSLAGCSRTVTKTDPKSGEKFSYTVPPVFTKEKKEPGWLVTHAFYNEDWPLVVKCAYWIGPGH